MEPTIAVVGTGDFAAYFIAALRNGAHHGRILLSPHSRRAQSMARELNCEVAQDGADLLAQADWILVAVRPEQLDAALAGLALRADHVVLSAVAGVSVAELRRRLGNVQTVTRIMPSSYIAAMPDGLVPLFPAIPDIERVLARAGTVIAFEKEEHFELSTAAACMSGWMYHFMDSLESWFIRQGLPSDQARRLVAGNILGALAQAKSNSDINLRAIGEEIATEGTYTRLGLDILLANAAMQPWEKALDAVADKLG